MSWQRRLLDLVCAGGAIAATPGCTPSAHCGNADPDPCICGHENDDTPQCNAERTCSATGGSWDYDEDVGSNGIVGYCVAPRDAGSDGPSGSDVPRDAAAHD